VLSETLDVAWMRSVNRMRAVVCVERLDDEVYAEVEALTWHLRNSAKGLMFGTPIGFPNDGRGVVVRDGLQPETAHSLVRALQDRTGRPFVVAPSNCVFAFPAGC